MQRMNTMPDLELDQAIELLENVNVGFIVLTADWKCSYANAEAERMVGLPRAELVGGRLTDLFPAIQGTEIQRMLEATMHTRVHAQGEHEDGIARRSYEYRAFPIRGGGICICLYEVTARKLAESARAERDQQLQESEQRFRLLADCAPVLIWIAGPDGKWTWLNRTWLDFRGRPMDQDCGMGWLEGVHEDDREACRSIHADRVASRESYGMELRLQRMDGEFRWMIARAVTRETADGAFAGFVGSMVDITERRIIEDERAGLLVKERLARAEAERANRIKDEFVATLSHELRTPINAILGWAQLLQMHRVSEAETIEAIQVIERNARVQAKLISDLLDMSKIIAGKIQLDVQSVDFREVIEDAIELVAQSANARNVKIFREFDPELAMIEGDHARLQQVVWNVLANAIKFSNPGGHVAISLRDGAGAAELTIRDNGKGIDPQFLPHIFERFSQADTSTTRRTGGLGLGLAISRHLVELHGGTIRAESEGLGKGAAITVRLPYRIARPAEREPERRTTTPTIAATSAGVLPEGVLLGARIVVVDDDPDARELLQRLLELHGASVVAVSSSEEGLAAVHRERPQVLISDIGMPGEDGYRFLSRVRELSPLEGWDVPAIALTAFARSEDRTRALAIGYHNHLAKPVDATELVETIARLLGR